MKKETAIDTLKELPSQFPLDDLIEKLLFVEKIEKGLKQLDEGKMKSHADVKKVVEGWKK